MNKEHLQAALFTLALHVVLLAALVFSGFRLVVPPPKGHGGIQAELVDLSQWQPAKKARKKPKPVKKQPKPKKPPVKKPQPKPQPKPKKQLATQPKPTIDTKARELQRQKDAERRRKLEEIRKQREAAERQRKREAERLAQLESRKQQRKPPEQATAGVTDGKEKARNALLARYIQSIKTRVASNWARPPTTPKGLRCRVRVRQIPGGGVIDASITGPCNADALVKKSIINAVKRSDPLPYEGFEDVFERSLSFTFTYDGET